MTRTQDIEAVRAACVKANPELEKGELTTMEDMIAFLAELINRRTGSGIANERSDSEYVKNKFLQPNNITLQDCILAIKKAQPGSRGHERLHICSDGLSHELQAVIWMWDPTETLEYQEDHTLRALSALLGNE